MDGKTPVVSVLMSFRTGAHIAEAVSSILSQTFGDFEFIIINDGSTSSARGVVLSFNDPRIRIIDNEKNMGLTRSLNRGLAEARGTYIARMDSDDIAMPQRFEKQRKFLDTHLDIAGVGTGIALIDKKGTVQRIKGALTDPELIRFRLAFQNQLVHSSMMLRADALRAVSGYSEEFVHAQDLELWGRMSAAGYRFSNISEPLMHYRLHEASITQGTTRGKAWEYGLAAIRKNLERYMPLTDTQFETFKNAFLLRSLSSLEETSWAYRFWRQLERAYLTKEKPSPATAHEIQKMTAWERYRVPRWYIKTKLRRFIGK